MFFELCDFLKLLVIVEDKIGYLQVPGRVSFWIGDINLDELDGHRHFVLKDILRGISLGLSRWRRS